MKKKNPKPWTIQSYYYFLLKQKYTLIVKNVQQPKPAGQENQSVSLDWYGIAKTTSSSSNPYKIQVHQKASLWSLWISDSSVLLHT